MKKYSAADFSECEQSGEVCVSCGQRPGLMEFLDECAVCAALFLNRMQRSENKVEVEGLGHADTYTTKESE